MSNGLLYIAGLIALALAALFAVPYFVDWNGYRGVFEEEATRILGREVRVGGNVNVRLLPSPYVSFEKLRIADPTGSTGEPFFRAESFTMRLSAPPLLKGIIEANEIVLEKPFLRLAVDQEGGGNWRSFSVAPGALPFVPAGVTLQSVKINDGTVALHGPKGIGFAQIGDLNGELKAESIDGPFSFKGTTKSEAGERELRIATGAAEADGSLRFKATIRSTGAESNVYAMDGRIEDLKGRPRVAGELTAKLALPADEAVAAAPAVAGHNGKAQPPLLDFKAHVEGDARGLRVDDIALSFENVGQPQLIAGSATATWADTLNIDMNLSSRWLDLDRVAKSPQASSDPLATARGFVTAVMEALPNSAESKVSFDLDQATLGGEAVSGIKLVVAREQGTLLLSKLQAGLPGGARVAFDGSSAASGQGIAGDITLYGTSLSRFLNWAAKGKSLAEAMRNEGPFSLQGQLAMNERGVSLTDAGVEIAGRPITGELHYTSKDRPRLSIALEGNEIDAGALWPAGVAGLKRVLSGGEGAAGAKSKLDWVDPASMDLQLRVRTGSLVTEHGNLRDVDMDVGMEQGRFAVRACKFAAADGLKVELEGNLADTLNAPKGALQWIVSAPSKEAYSTLVQLFDLPDAARQQIDALSTLAPMRLAGAVQLGRRQSQSADVSIDGKVQDGGRFVLNALLDGGLDNWRAAPADITANISAFDVASVLSALSGRKSADHQSASPQAGEIFLKAAGIPTAGLTTTVAAKAPTLFLAYDGRVTLPENGGRAVNGEVRVAARGLGEALAVAGLGGGDVLREAAISGTLKVASADHAYEVKAQDLTIGGSKIKGSVALSYPTEGPAIVTGDVGVDAASIPGLLALVLDHKEVAEAPAAEPLAQGKTIWPEHAFDFTALDGLEGKLSISFNTLVLTDKMALSKARAELELAAGKVTVSKLEGSALGGSINADVVLERAPGGADLKAAVRMANLHVRPKPMATAGTKVESSGGDDTTGLTLDLSGRASTPGALISVLTGKGELQLGDISVHAPTPLAVVATSEAVLNGEAGGTGEQLAAALRTQIDETAVKVGPRTIPIVIADGAAKLEPVTLTSDAGTTKVTTTVDLASLMVDSTWVVEPRGPDIQPGEKPKHALPSVNVVYTGPLANAWALDQRITTEPLERELAIRKMELDADQLERLHKADAERAHREEERKKALESDEGASLPGSADAPAPMVAPQSENGPVEPAAPQDAAATPVIPPSSASAPGVAVPPAPGQEGQTFGASQGVDPTTGVPTVAGSISPPAATPAPAYRQRPRTQRQVQPNEQVIRNLLNNGN